MIRVEIREDAASGVLITDVCILFDFYPVKAGQKLYKVVNSALTFAVICDIISITLMELYCREIAGRNGGKLCG